jgi:cysteine desulfurase/selenocysteine lyase
LAFSGHKIYGPTGIGVLYGKRKLLEEMPPFLSGGGMIANVSEIGFESADIPHKFEAGTPAIAEAIGLGSAIKWMDEIGCDAMYAHTQFLIKTAHEKFSTIKGITIFGPQKNERRGCISFTIDGIHAHDLTEILGRKNICLRAGHHCTEPLHKALKVPATTRLSVAVYNTEAEIDTCVAAIEKAVHFFRG